MYAILSLGKCQLSDPSIDTWFTCYPVSSSPLHPQPNRTNIKSKRIIDYPKRYTSPPPNSNLTTHQPPTQPDDAERIMTGEKFIGTISIPSFWLNMGQALI